MDPITVIVTALIAGAAAAAKDVSVQAVKDAYNGLKTVVVKGDAHGGIRTGNDR
jgi:hypothetical protein